MKVVLGDVAVVVRDAKASAQWWKGLGFEVRDDSGHWVTVAPRGANVVLHLCQGPPPEEGNTGIGFFVDSVEEVEKAWGAKGVRFTVPRTVGEASVQARFVDPDGNEFWLFEDDDLKARPKPARRKAPAKAKKAARPARGAKAKAGKARRR